MDTRLIIIPATIMMGVHFVSEMQSNNHILQEINQPTSITTQSTTEKDITVTAETESFEIASAPPEFQPSLDFSDSRNSMYLGTIF